MRYILICKRYYTNKDLISDRFGRLYHIPFELASRGNEVVVIAADYRGGAVETSTIGSVVFHSIPLTLASVITYFRMLCKIIKQHRPEVIMSSSDTYFGVIGMLFSWWYKLPLVFDVYDEYAAFKSNQIPGVKYLYKKVMQKSDLVTCASKLLQESISRYNKNTLVVENGVDTTVFKPMNSRAIRKKLNVNDGAIVVGYFGSMDRSHHGLSYLIMACQQLREHYPDLCVLLAGKLPENYRIAHKWVTYMGIVSQAEVAECINACDVVVIPYVPSPQVDVSQACKISEYLACEVPVVATRVADYAAYFATATQAICRPGDAEDMARAISRQINNPQLAPLPRELVWGNLAARVELAVADIVIRDEEVNS